MNKVADSFIKPNDRLTSFERLEIYNRVYWFRVLDCLYDDYPGLRAVLGERKFMVRRLVIRLFFLTLVASSGIGADEKKAPAIEWRE